MLHNIITNLTPFYNEDTNTLDLSSQGLIDGYDIYLIVLFLCDHPEIRSLNLNNNDIGDVGVKALTDALKGTKITTLSLANNDPKGEKRFMGKALLKAISSLPTLSEVDISHNGIHMDDYYIDIRAAGNAYDSDTTTPEFAVLSKELSGHPQLTKLNMSHNRIKSKKLFKLFISIPTLTELNISKNDFPLHIIDINDIPTSCGLINLDVSHNWTWKMTALEVFVSIPTLRELNISHNHMNGQLTENTKLALSKSHLVKLNIGYNFLVYETILMLFTIPTLTDLDLSDTDLRPFLIEMLKINRQLSKLNISRNACLSEYGHRFFNKSLVSILVTTFPNLTELDCGNPRMTPTDVDSLARFSSLRKLSILTRLSREDIVTLLSNPSLEELNTSVWGMPPDLVKTVLNADLPLVKKFNFLRNMLCDILQAEKSQATPIGSVELTITVLNFSHPSIEKSNFLRHSIDISPVNLITSKLINEFLNSNFPLREKTNFLRQIWHKLDAAQKKGERIYISKAETISLEKKARVVPSLLEFTKHDLLQTVPEIKECDLLVIEVENPEKYMASVNLIMKEAKEKNTPVIAFIQSVKKYYIYGDKDNDGHWDFVEISDLSSQDLEPLFDKNKKHWREKTTSPIKLIKRDELSSVLLEQLSKYHFNLELVEKRSYARSDEEIPTVKQCYDTWHSRINKLIKYEFNSFEDVGNFLKLSSNWIDELEKDKKRVAGIPEAILVSKDKKDLLRFLGIVNEQYLSPKRHEAETLQTFLIIHDKANAYIQKSEETWPRNEIDQLNFHQTKKALNELLINLASFQADEAKLVKLKDKLEPHFYAMTIQPIQTVIKQINDKRDALEGHLSELMKVHSKINEMKDTWVSYLEAIKNENTEGIESNGLRESFRRYLADIDRLKQYQANLQGLKDQVDLLDPSFYAKITPLLEATAQAIRSKIVEIQKAEAETAKHIVTDWKHRGEVFLAYLKSGPKTEDDHVQFLSAASSLKQPLDKAKEIIEHSLCHKAIKDAAIVQLDEVYLFQITPAVDEVKVRILKTINKKIKDKFTQAGAALQAADKNLRDTMTSIKTAASQKINPVSFHNGKPIYSYPDRLTYGQRYQREFEETVKVINQILADLMSQKEILEKTSLKSEINRINDNPEVTLDPSKTAIEEVDKKISDMKDKIKEKIKYIIAFQNILDSKLKEISQKIISLQKESDNLLEKIRTHLIASKSFKMLGTRSKNSTKQMQVNAYLDDIRTAKTLPELIKAVEADPKDVTVEKKQYVHEQTMRENTGCGLYGLFSGESSTTDHYAKKLQDALHKFLNTSNSKGIKLRATPTKG